MINQKYPFEIRRENAVDQSIVSAIASVQRLILLIPGADDPMDHVFSDPDALKHCFERLHIATGDIESHLLTLIRIIGEFRSRRVSE